MAAADTSIEEIWLAKSDDTKIPKEIKTALKNRTQILADDLPPIQIAELIKSEGNGKTKARAMAAKQVCPKFSGQKFVFSAPDE